MRRFPTILSFSNHTLIFHVINEKNLPSRLVYSGLLVYFGVQSTYYIMQVKDISTCLQSGRKTERSKVLRNNFLKCWLWKNWLWGYLVLCFSQNQSLKICQRRGLGSQKKHKLVNVVCERPQLGRWNFGTMKYFFLFILLKSIQFIIFFIIERCINPH